MKNKQSLAITQSAVIAALYVVLTMISNLFGLASNAIQVRISEALCVLPIFTFAAVPGVTIGCLIANFLTTSNPFDILFGTLATLIGASIAYLIRNTKPVQRFKALVALPTILANTLIISPVIVFVFMNDTIAALPLTALFVFLGEFIACGILGYLLIKAITPHRNRLFPQD